MLFSTTSDVYSNLGAVSQSVFGDIWPYIVLVIGIPLAFFIIEMLVDLIRGKDQNLTTGYYKTSGERYRDQKLGRAVYDVQTKGITEFDE